MPSIKDYIEHYDIKTKTLSRVCGGEVIEQQVFKICPYVWMGQLKEKIEKGIITFVAWKKRGPVCLQ